MIVLFSAYIILPSDAVGRAVSACGGQMFVAEISNHLDVETRQSLDGGD